MEGIMGTDGKEKCFVAFPFELIQGYILTESGVEMKFNAKFFELGHFTVNYFSGKAIARDAQQKHAAGNAVLFDDLHPD